MDFLDKEYKVTGSENYDGFLKALGLPDEQVEILAQFEPSLKLVQNDDGTYSQFSILNGEAEETKFTPGVEIPDDLEDDNNPMKTLFTIEDNVVTQVKTGEDGSTTTFKREYDGDDLTETITADKFDGEAKRFYKA